MRIGTFNVRGILIDDKKADLATDFKRYSLDVLCVQETHIPNTNLINIRGEQGNKIKLYHTGTEEDSHHGVGIAVDVDRKVLFKRINNRICYVKLLDNNTTVICAYSPTNDNTRKNPKETENFYTALNDTLNNFSKKEQIFIAADFNAQVGIHHKDYPQSIGKHYKGHKRDENSKFLINLLTQNQLIVTNTKFKHKLAHTTTWECNNRRKYPVRNQIDFILCKTNTFFSVTNSRSYSGTRTSSDHRLVICDIPKFKWHKIFPKKKVEQKVNCEKIIKNIDINKKYKREVREKFQESKRPTNNQERWDRITEVCIGAGKKIAGNIERKKHIEHKDLTRPGKQYRRPLNQ